MQRHWDGYDAIAQTRDAQKYIREHRESRPFLLMLSWGPPHEPYETAPEEYRRLYDPAAIRLRPNVPASIAAKAREWLAGYYAHCSALDACVGELLGTIRECGIERNTIFVFTSDHGDMLGSQGERKKQRPWDESIRVPFLLRYPGLPGWRAGETKALLDAPDIMPTLLELCGLPIPATADGLDFSGHIAGGPDPSDGAALIQCPHPFGQWCAGAEGGREYRGLRTARYTYVRDLRGPWLLYDNDADPYQMRNVVHEADYRETRDQLEERLRRKLESYGDRFEPGNVYHAKWGYRVDEKGTVPYTI